MACPQLALFFSNIAPSGFLGFRGLRFVLDGFWNGLGWLFWLVNLVLTAYEEFSRLTQLLNKLLTLASNLDLQAAWPKLAMTTGSWPAEQGGSQKQALAACSLLAIDKDSYRVKRKPRYPAAPIPLGAPDEGGVSDRSG